MATLLFAAVFGIGVGVVAGLLGIGGGTLMVPFLVLVAGLSQQDANATSLLVVLPTAIVATWTLARRGATDVGLSLKLGLLGAAGGVGGALLALALPGPALRVCFAAFLALTGVRLLRDGVRLLRAP